MKIGLQLLILALLSFWILGIFIQVFLPIFPQLIYIYPFIELTYSHVCHQQPEKLIAFGFGQTLTCARCTGIYVGCFLSAILLLIKKHNVSISYKFFILAIALILVDIFMYSIEFYNYSKIIALLTGMFLGSIVFYYFYKGLNDFYYYKKTN